MTGILPNTSVLTNSCSEKLNQTCNDYLDRIMHIWSVIYGPNDANLNIRLEKLESNLEEFWKYQIEELENSKRSLANSVEHLGKQALALEKALGLKSGLDNIEDVPLANLEDQLWKLLQSYNEIKDKRQQDFDTLRKQEKDLCAILEETCQLGDAFPRDIMDYGAKESNPPKKVPSDVDIASAAQRIAYLEELLEELKRDFHVAKVELHQLLDECEVLPLSKVERFACLENGEVDFPCTKNNYAKLLGHIKKYRTIKEQAEIQAGNLREQVSTLWIKMLKNETELGEFMSQHQGCKKSVIMRLGNKLNELQVERRENLKELIIQQRSLLDDLWTECKYTDDQRNQFQAYHINCFTENVLDEHEQEVARIQEHLSVHRRTYQLADKYFELWERLLHLEDLAKQSDRLFKNRGGQLLQEEKERKVVQKKLPKIKEELRTLAIRYREEEGDDLLYLGRPLLSTLEEMEEERQASKENQKLQRKAANVETVKTEYRLGARPVVAGCKRKFLTPQHPNVSTKLLKMSSTSSSTNSLASSKSASQERFKMQRNEVASQRKRENSPECTFAVPRTPVKTPGKTPVAAAAVNGTPRNCE